MTFSNPGMPGFSCDPLKNRKSRRAVVPAVLAALFVASCEPVNEEPDFPVVGGEDEHGCVETAGYTWDAEAQKCVRYF